MSDDQCRTDEINDTKTCLSRGQSIGAALEAESGLISLASLCILLVLIVRNVYRNSKRPLDERRSLVQEPADVLMLSLFAADLLQGIGAAMSIRWANFGYVEIGKFCTTQGSIQQLGETAVAMSTLSIALQTFIAVCFRKFVHSRKPAVALVFLIWLFVILFVTIGASVNGSSKYYAPTPYWCWIDRRFPTERIMGEYLWLWLTLFVSILVYIPLFLWGNGYLSVDKTRWWRITFRFRPRAESEEADTRERPPSLSLVILGYPVLYSILILPLTLTRWISFSHSNTPSAATFSVVFIFGLSGAANVILLIWTRPNLLLFDSERIQCEDCRHDDLEPGGATRPRGRTGRRKLHEKGRMTTPSRSTSRESRGWMTQQDFGDHFELGPPANVASVYPEIMTMHVRRSGSVPRPSVSS